MKPAVSPQTAVNELRVHLKQERHEDCCFELGSLSSVNTGEALKLCKVHFSNRLAVAVCLALMPSAGSVARCQAIPTAQRKLDLSVFAGGSGVYTGLGSGRNIAITAGVDVGFSPRMGFYPSAEIRGSYPLLGGILDDQRNVLAGLKVARKYGFLYPYVDFLAGRGQINYHNGYPAPVPGLFYLQTASAVLSPGTGVALDVGGPFRLIADAQLQRYSTPATKSGHLYAESFTFGVQYRFR